MVLASKLVCAFPFFSKDPHIPSCPRKKILIALVRSLNWQKLYEHRACSYLSLPQVVAVYGTLSDLLSVASNKLGIKATSVYNGKGGLIDDIALIR